MGDTEQILLAGESIHIAMCLRVRWSRATASERAMVRASESTKGGRVSTARPSSRALVSLFIARLIDSKNASSRTDTIQPIRKLESAQL